VALSFVRTVISYGDDFCAEASLKLILRKNLTGSCKAMHSGVSAVVICGFLVVSQNPYPLLSDCGRCSLMLALVFDIC
jgi:hypothetical protein